MPAQILDITTAGRGFVEITSQLAAAAAACGVVDGVLSVFIRHTSASLIVCENADPVVLRDLGVWMNGLVADGDKRFEHTLEGPDDMAAHVRSVLTASSLMLPIVDGRLALGAWQGVFVWEHRHRGHRRQVVATPLAAV